MNESKLINNNYVKTYYHCPKNNSVVIELKSDINFENINELYDKLLCEVFTTVKNIIRTSNKFIVFYKGNNNIEYTNNHKFYYFLNNL